MKQVRLTARTRRGQNKIDQHGDVWHLHKVEPTFMGSDTMLLESKEKTFQAHVGVGQVQEWQTDWRWVSMHKDKDFVVEIL
jgi:hypothetical protein